VTLPVIQNEVLKRELSPNMPKIKKLYIKFFLILKNFIKNFFKFHKNLLDLFSAKDRQKI